MIPQCKHLNFSSTSENHQSETGTELLTEKKKVCAAKFTKGINSEDGECDVSIFRYAGKFSVRLFWLT